MFNISTNTKSTTPYTNFYYGNKDSARLSLAWAHATGLVGGGSKAEELGQNIAALFETKGDLVVLTRKSLSADVETLFCRAWDTVGGEKGQLVEFRDEKSDQLEGLSMPDGFWPPSLGENQPAT